MTMAVRQNTMHGAADLAEQAGALGWWRLFMTVATTVAMSVRMSMAH